MRASARTILVQKPLIVLETYSCEDLQAILKVLKVNFVVVVVVECYIITLKLKMSLNF